METQERIIKENSDEYRIIKEYLHQNYKIYKIYDIYGLYENDSFYIISYFKGDTLEKIKINKKIVNR